MGNWTPETGAEGLSLNCGKCGTDNRDGARFCIACGETLALRCAGCGTEVPSGAKFCDSCGTPVAVQLMVEREAAATRKTVTVLFSDLTGSTSLGERLDPESVRALMAPVYAAMRGEVESRGGYVAKFVGDGVMAIFGIPEVHEDDAMRALDAAVGMRQAIDQLSADMPVALSLKVGLNTGEVVTGAGDEDVVGDCVNVASRLEGAAAPGEVLVGEETWRLTRSNATYEPVAPLTLKGKTEPVPAYRIVSLERTQEAASATFVGRDDELLRLRRAFDEAVEANSSRLVAIIGSPGLGKTRLARELGNALSDVALVVETQCDAAGMATFAPVAETLRLAIGVDESADSEAVVEAIKAVIPDEEGRDRIAQRAAALLGAGEAGSTEETFWAIRRLVEAAARIRPLVLILDDLHWAEPLLLDLVEHLAQWIRTAPVLLVVTGRPELREIRSSLVERDVAISLEGLDGYATEALARGLLGSDRVPRELLARLPASTEGNPLFVREFVRMLVDDGILRRSGDEWIATVNVDAIEVPPTIQSLLAARVERLTQHERTVLELASVIGKEFYSGAINELAPATVRVGLDAHLESLRRKELVEPAGTYWIDEPVFRFHHALIQDAAYRRLLKESRADLHERVAGWLEQKTQGLLGEHDELIGYHVEQAHESRRQLGLLDDHTTALGERAAALLASAARRALDLDDLPAAAALSGRALERLEAEHPDRPEILLVRCESLLAMGDVSAATPAVWELADISSSPRLHAWADCFSGELANLTDPTKLRETEKRVSVAAGELADLGDAAGAAKAHTVRATSLAGLGQVAACESALDDALTAAREAGDRRRVTDVLGRAPTAALWGPSPVSRAGGRCLDIVRLLRITTGSPAVEATSLRCQAVLEAFRGRTDAARRMLRKARRDLEELGLQHGIHETELFAGIVELAAGDPAAAEPQLRAAHEGLLAMRVDVHAARAAALLARAHLAMGEEDEAERFADESERLGGDDLKTAIAWRAVRAQILARRGRIDEARGLAESAVEIAARTDALIDHGDACLALAAVCSSAGDVAGARRAADQAASLYERKGATALLEVVRKVEAPTHQPVSASAAPAGPENDCTLVGRRFAAMFENRDWAACGSLLAPDVCIDDRRAVISYGLIEGREPALEIVKSMAEVGTVRCELTSVATRGRFVALAWVDLSGPVVGSTSFGARILQVAETDEDGVIRRMVNFDPDDFDAAIAELDERYIAGEGAEFAEFVSVSSRFLRAVNQADESTCRRLCTEDIIQIDHRPASLGEMRGLSAFVESIIAIQELVPGLRIHAPQFIALRADAAVATFLTTGKTPDGAEIEQTFSAVSVLRDGMLARIERFPADDLGAAIARFHELGEQQSAEGPSENASSRVARRLAELFEQQDWDGWDSLLAEDMVAEDRRHLMRQRPQLLGKAAALEGVKIAANLGATHVDHELIATRGERQSLQRLILRGNDDGAGSFEVEYLQLLELDAQGLVRRFLSFEPDDFDVAMAELDERYVGGEGAEFADVISVTTRVTGAISRGDIDFVDLMASDFVQVDHRPAYFGEMAGPDAFADSVAAIQELVPGLSVYTQSFVALRADAAVGRLLTTGKTPDGADIEQAFSAVVVVRDGLLKRVERFPADDLDAALARFNELDVEGRDELSTPCTRAIEEHLEVFLRSNWAALGALLADDVLWVDKRAGLQNEVRGRMATLDSYRAIAEVGVKKIERRVVATRGHELSLSHEVFGAEGVPYEAEMLALNQIDGGGRIVYRAVFDPADLDTAIEELDERYIAGEGAEFAESVALVTGFLHAFSRRDTNTSARLIAEDVVQIDHRPASLGEMHGRDEFMESADALMGLLAEIHTYARTFEALRSDACVLSLVASGKTTDGAEIEQAYYVVGLTRGGQVTRIERFAPDDLEVALARFHELGEPVPREGPPENECWRASSRLGQLFEARDWAGFEAALADDIDYDDHRTFTADQARGRSAVMGVIRSVAESGILRINYALIATRGERLALVRNSLIGRELGSAPFETVFLTVFEIDEQGKICALLPFEADDFDAALAELDDRFLADEGSGAAGSAQLMALRAINSQDWGAARAAFADDVVVIDHRQASFGEVRGVDAYVDYVRAHPLRQPAATGRPVLRSFARAVHAWTHDVLVSELVTEGRDGDGLLFETTWQMVAVERGARVERMEYFALDRLEAALARFEELTHEPPSSALDNACLGALTRLLQFFEQRDWDAVAAMYTPESEMEDRRTGIRARQAGRDARVEVLRSIADVGVARVLLEPLAIRGERLALVRMLLTGPADTVSFETEVLTIYEINEEGLIGSSVVLDGRDVDEAFAELDERYAAGEAMSSEVAPAVADLLAAMNARDWSKLRSILSDSLTVVDHRPASLGELGPDEWIESYKVLVDLLPDVRVDAKAYRALEAGRAITENQLWSLSDGALVESRLFALHHIADGKFVHFEFFPIDCFDLARARFEELDRTEPVATPTLENAARRVAAIYADAVLAADWEAYVRVVSEDSVFDDRRSGLQSIIRGRDARLEHARATSSIGVRRGSTTPLAIRGERLLLSRVVVMGDQEVSFETELLMLTELDAEGKICASVAFGAEDVDGAFAELDERYAAGEGAPYAETLRFRRFISAYNARDWDGMRAASASDLHVLDHRPASFGHADNPDEMIRIFRTLIDLVPDIRIDPVEIHAINGELMLTSLRVWGTSTEGAEIELNNITISRVRDGLVSDAEIFPSDQLDQALARFEELSAVGPRGLRNACSKVFQKILRLFEQRRWDELGELYADGFVVEDRRPGLGNAAQGRAGSVEGWQAAAGVGAVRARGSALATRGERLALTSVHFTGVDDSPDAFASELVFLNELDEDGRIVFAALLDPDDLDAAFVELDERYIVGEGAPYAELFRGMADSLRAHAERDLEKFAFVTDDFVYIDHSPSRFGRVEGRDAFLRQHRELIDVIPDVRIRVVSVLAIDTERCMWEELISGTNTEGGDVEIRSYVVGRIRDGRASLLEEYPLDQRDAALACFDRLGADGSLRGALENAATRTADAYGRAFESHDWAAMEQLLSEDSVWDDRRRGLQSIIQGRAARMENVRAISSVGALHFSYTPVAVRGERLALERAVVTGPEDSDFYVEQLMVVEVDESGRASATVVFDPDDANAFAELEERYMRGEGAAHADVLRAGLPMLRALNARDWDGFRSLLADDLVFVDHRPASLGEVRGADRRVQELRTLLELLADYQVDVTRFHALAAAAALGAVIIRGTTTDGAQVEIAYHMLYALRGDLVARMEVWPMEDLGGALAKFDEFPESDSPDAGSLDNTALRVLRTANDLMEREDWEGFAQQHAENVRLVDGRRGLQSEVQGRQGVVDFNRTTSEVARYRVGIEPLAVRGDRLALARLIVTPPDGRQGFEVELLNVSEVNAEGLAIYSRQFDADDIDAAFAELDDRYIAGEGAPIAEMVRATGRVPQAVIAQDWPAFRDVLTEDFVLVDHRPASMGELSSDEWIESWTAFSDLVPDLRTRVVAYHAVAPDGCVAEVVSGGISREGGSVETVIFGVIQLRGDCVCRLEAFPIDRKEDALARFEELRTSRPAAEPALENRCTRTVARVVDGFEQRDWEIVADCHSEDTVEDDRRTGFKTLLRGRDEVVGNIRAIADVGTHRIDQTVVATRGDQLALFRFVFRGRDEAPATFGIEALLVFETDVSGRVSVMVMFDPEDLDTAFAELDARYLASPDATTLDRLGAEFVGAFNDRDWERMRSQLLSEDFIYVDHQLAGVGTLEGVDAYVRSVSTLLEMLPEYQLRLAGNYVQEGWGTVARLRERGVDSNGNVVEFEYASVVIGRDDRLVRAENYAIEELDAALARFEELTSSDTTHGLENDCTRLLRRAIRLYGRRDWDALAECLAEHGVSEDRRVGLRHEYVGRDARIESLRVGADLGAARLSFVPIGTRGQRLALCRYRREGPSDGGFETETLELDELDESGRHKGTVMFDPDDLDAAFAELEERYLAGEGSAYSHVWGVFVSLAEAYGRDWEMYASLLTDDLIFIDHRPASLGRMDGPQELIRSQKALIELVPDMRWRVESIEALERDGFAVRMHAPGTSAEGAQVEFDLYFVGKVREGRLELLEFFPVDQRDAALARFEELAHERPDHPRTLENAVTRMAVRYAAAFESQNWATMEQLLTEESVWDDRRPGFQSVVRGRDIRIENVRAMASVGALHFSYTPMATRGDRLALLRAVVSGPADSEFKVETVMVAEVDEQGRASVTVVFEPEDLDGAFAELDDRYLLLEDAERSSSWRVVASAIRAFNARDWDAWSASASDDFVYVDHCPANMGRIESRDAAVRMDQALIDVIPDLKIRIGAIEAITDDCCLVRGNSSGTNSGGGAIELASYAVIYVHDGKVKRMEEYPIDQIDAAWARFRELCSTGAEPRPLENLASRAVVLSAEAILRADWDAYAALQSPDFRGQDRRSALRMEYGWKERIENARAILAVGVTHIESECLAVRGERLALVRSTYSDAERTLEVQVVGVIEVDDEERFVFGSVLDPDNLDAAFDELDERYIASLEDPQVARISAQFAKAFNSRDWDGMRLLMGADFVYVDHQPAGVGTVEGFDVYVHTVSTLLDLVPDLRIALTEIFAMSDCGVAYRLHEHGTDDNGNAIQFEYAGVGVTNDGRITRIENFPIEELDAALARFEELATPS